ncbi:MAG: hypothetical protein IJK95_04230 [Firmicutes bacterium]|nr:hypothetical protein [Bacillota bacterium]
MGRNGIKKQFWMSKELTEELSWKASQACLTETALIKKLIQGYHPPQAPGKEFYDALNRVVTSAENLKLQSEFINDPQVGDILQEAAKELKELNLQIKKHYLSAERERIKWR